MKWSDIWSEAIFESLKMVWTLVVLIFWFRNIFCAITACTLSISRPLKMVWTCGTLNMLISKYTSYYNGVYFFDILTSKNRPTLRCFIHFELEMWFALQRHIFFRHLNFQKWSENSVFYIFYFGTVLRTTTAYIFSTF